MTRALVARANLLVFAVLMVLFALVAGITWDRLTAANATRMWTQRGYEVLNALKDLNLVVREAESGQRGYLLTGNDEYLRPYQTALGQIGFLEGTLQRLAADNPAEQDHLRALGPLVQRKLEELAQTIELRRTYGLDAAMRIVNAGKGKDAMQRIQNVVDQMTEEETATLDGQLRELARRAGLVRWLAFGGAAIAALALLWAARLLNQAWSQSYRFEAEQRALALRLRTSLDSLSQGVAVFGADFRLLHWNHCFEVLLDVPPDLLHAGTPYAAFHDRIRPLLESEDEIRHAPRVAGVPVVYERTGPHAHELELRRTPMPDGGFVLTVSDMTRRVKAENVLREAQKMQAIGQLTGGIAHDFNNLLTVILGNLELVRSRLDGDAGLQRRIERAVNAAQRGATLTGQLLAFARRQPLAPAPIDLAATMPELIPLLRRTLGEYIDVRYVETAGLWPAMADAAQLEAAVLNLALNARDAMPGGGRLTIELANKVLDADYARRHAEVAPGDYAMLAVSDTGHGMTPEVAARAFEPFFTTKLDGKGTGLGLAMVFGFVKQSGGHVKVYSEPGEGTTVRLYLPRASAAAAGPRGAAPMQLPRGSATILVVEDDAAVREVAVAILRDLGYRVIGAADGEAGLAAFEAHAAEIALVLTDVVLPGTLRGQAMAARMAAIRPEVRVLYMSGYTENSIVHQGRLDEGVQLITKPFKRDELARRVADLLVPAED